MSKQYNIRWRQDDEKELKRVVRNFNAKIDRLAKKDPKSKNALPERVTVKQMKELIDTRKDLTRELNALRRFSKKGNEKLVDVPDNEYNLQVTKWQRDEMSRRTGLINRKRNKRLKELADVELRSRGEELGYTRGQLGMGKADEISLKPLRAFTPKMTRTELNKKFKAIKKESQSTYFTKKDEILRRNYINSLLENYREKDIAEVIDVIENMDFKDFLTVFKYEDALFEFNYPPDEDTYQSYLSSVKAVWLPNKDNSNLRVSKGPNANNLRVSKGPNANNLGVSKGPTK